MRVLFVTSELFPWVRGGPQVVMYNLACGLVRQADLETICISPPDGSRLQEHYPEEIVFRPIKDVRAGVLKYPYRNIAYLREAGRMARPDIVHFHILPGANCFALPLILKRKGIQMVLSLHDWVPNELPYYGNVERVRHVVHWHAAKRNLRLFDLIVVNSSFMREIAVSGGLQSVEVIPNGINMCEWRELGDRRQGEGRYIFFWGKLYAKKGVERLIRAFAVCCPERTDWKLLIAGDGPEEGRYRGLTRHLGLEKRVVFLGPLSDAGLKRYLGACDLCVFPSEYEGFGIAILEAMAAGKPVITTVRGGQTDFARNGENARLVDPDDPGALEKAMAELIDDAQQRQRLAENARLTAERYDWSRIVPLYMDLYRRLVGGGGVG